jgi:hypothetical protein
MHGGAGEVSEPAAAVKKERSGDLADFVKRGRERRPKISGMDRRSGGEGDFRLDAAAPQGGGRRELSTLMQKLKPLKDAKGR